MRRLLAVLLAVFALVLAPIRALADTDLRALLVEPSGADWIETGPSPTVLDGAFTINSYVSYLTALGGKPGTTAIDLGLGGFTRGYSRRWDQHGTQDFMIEQVFEFRATSGAVGWYRELMTSSQLPPEYTGNLTGTSVIPNSYGSLISFSDGTNLYEVAFEKGNADYIIDMYSSTNDLTAPAVKQAAAVYQNAPSTTQAPAASASPSADGPRYLLLVVLLALPVMLFAYGANRARRKLRG
jgi:hypothetical protein